MLISLTRLDGSLVHVNPDNIQWVENMPDTVVTFLGGARLVVRERVEDIDRLMRQFSLDTTPSLQNSREVQTP